MEKEGETTFYIEAKLKKNLDNIKKKINTKDRDYVLLVDGEEGSGKSVLAMQIGYYIDPTLCLDRVVMNGTDFMNAIKGAGKGQCVIYDEAYSGLSSRGSLSEINNLIVSLMTEMRQKNLFVIVVLPSFFILDKYVSLWRSRSLVHCYFKNGNRGRYIIFNKSLKKVLYMKGKKEFSYRVVKSRFKGKFYNKYVVDEAEYRVKKDEALKRKNVMTRASKFQEQRNRLLYALRKECKMSLKEIAILCNKVGVNLKQTQISDSINTVVKPSSTSPFQQEPNDDKSDENEPFFP